MGVTIQSLLTVTYVSRAETYVATLTIRFKVASWSSDHELPSQS